jgi:hypothetical protein
MLRKVAARLPRGGGAVLIAGALAVGVILLGMTLAAPLGALSECDKTNCGWGWPVYRAAAWVLLALFVLLLSLGIGSVLLRRRG